MKMMQCRDKLGQLTTTSVGVGGVVGTASADSAQRRLAELDLAGLEGGDLLASVGFACGAVNRPTVRALTGRRRRGLRLDVEWEGGGVGASPEAAEPGRHDRRIME